MDPRLQQRRIDDQSSQKLSQVHLDQQQQSSNGMQMYHRGQPSQSNLRDDRRSKTRDSHQDNNLRDSSNSQSQIPSHRQPQQEPQGPPKRNKHLQEPEVDAFQPRYTLSYEQPDIPVRPKLFRYRLDGQRQYHAYEFSSVEMNRDHFINVDYNMGMRVDLVDRDVYQLDPSGEQSKLTNQQLEEVRNRLLTDRDRFVLSDKDTFVETTKVKKHQPLVVPNIKDNQAASRQEYEANSSSQAMAQKADDQVIMTDPKNASKKELAIKQIEKGFENNKRVKSGIQKPGKPEVTAKRVMDVLPCFQSVPYQLSLVVNEEDFEEHTLALNRLNNGQLMYNFEQEDDQDNWQALYKFQSAQNIPDDLFEVCLGKRKSDQDLWAQELQSAVQLEHVRDYSCSLTHGGQKGEQADYMLFEDNKNGCFRYVAIENKMVLNKRKRAKKDQMISQMDEDNFEQSRVEQQANMNQTEQARNIVIAARGYEKKELHTTKQSYTNIAKSDSHKPLDLKDALFDSKKTLTDMEKSEASNLKVLFKVQATSKHEDDEQLIKEDSDDIDLFNAPDDAGAAKKESIKDNQSVKEEQSQQANSPNDDMDLSDDEGLFS